MLSYKGTALLDISNVKQIKVISIGDAASQDPLATRTHAIGSGYSILSPDKRLGVEMSQTSPQFFRANLDDYPTRYVPATTATGFGTPVSSNNIDSTDRDRYEGCLYLCR
jgi:hypothetical protein